MSGHKSNPQIVVPDHLPKLLDLTMHNITENTKIINSQGTLYSKGKIDAGNDERLTFLINKLTEHLHDFARETALTTDEWMAAIQFLTAVGQICSNTRQEFILLSDILGCSVLVDALNHPKPPGATENTVLGPFFTEDAADVKLGESIVSDVGDEKWCLVKGKVTDENGGPIEGAIIEVWETDETGHYDTQYADRDHPDYRGRLRSDKDGNFWFKAIRPVPYPIPHDGPVGKLLKKLNRHPYRPSHMHFMIIAEGYDTLVTALYVRGDPFETSDAVFGVKSSLIVDVKTVEDEAMAEQYGVTKGDWLIDWDFVMVNKPLADKLRKELAEKVMSGRADVV